MMLFGETLNISDTTAADKNMETEKMKEAVHIIGSNSLTYMYLMSFQIKTKYTDIYLQP